MITYISELKGKVNPEIIVLWIKEEKSYEQKQMKIWANSINSFKSYMFWILNNIMSPTGMEICALRNVGRICEVLADHLSFTLRKISHFLLSLWNVNKILFFRLSMACLFRFCMYFGKNHVEILFQIWKKKKGREYEILCT